MLFFFFQAEDGIRDGHVTGVQTCALPIYPALAAVTVMHAKPEVILDATEIIRGHFAGPIGAYAETGDWEPPNWVSGGLTPDQYFQQAIAWLTVGRSSSAGAAVPGPSTYESSLAGCPATARYQATEPSPGRQPRPAQLPPLLPPAERKAYERGTALLAARDDAGLIFRGVSTSTQAIPATGRPAREVGMALWTRL